MKNTPHRPPTGPVTIMHDGKLQLGTWKAGTVRRPTGSLIAANVQRSDEGVRWIRGHHAEDTPEGKALIAAAALAPARSDMAQTRFNSSTGDVEISLDGGPWKKLIGYQE